MEDGWAGENRQEVRVSEWGSGRAGERENGGWGNCVIGCDLLIRWTEMT